MPPVDFHDGWLDHETLLAGVLHCLLRLCHCCCILPLSVVPCERVTNREVNKEAVLSKEAPPFYVQLWGHAIRRCQLRNDLLPPSLVAGLVGSVQDYVGALGVRSIWCTANLAHYGVVAFGVCECETGASATCCGCCGMVACAGSHDVHPKAVAERCDEDGVCEIVRTIAVGGHQKRSSLRPSTALEASCSRVITCMEGCCSLAVNALPPCSLTFGQRRSEVESGIEWRGKWGVHGVGHGVLVELDMHRSQTADGVMDGGQDAGDC